MQMQETLHKHTHSCCALTLLCICTTLSVQQTMARIKQTSIIHGPNHRAAQKQLNLIKNLKSRMKEKYGVKKMAINKHGSKKIFTVGGAKPPPPTSSAPVASAAEEEMMQRKKHRWRPGTVAKREIRKMTRTTHLLFPKSTFSR